MRVQVVERTGPSLFIVSLQERTEMYVRVILLLLVPLSPRFPRCRRRVCTSPRPLTGTDFLLHCCLDCVHPDTCSVRCDQLAFELILSSVTVYVCVLCFCLVCRRRYWVRSSVGYMYSSYNPVYFLVPCFLSLPCQTSLARCLECFGRTWRGTCKTTRLLPKMT